MCKEVLSILFLWDNAVPLILKSWFETFANSHNTAPEYVFIGGIATCSNLNGPSIYVKYNKPTTNLFSMCEISQAFHMTTRDALQNIPPEICTILVEGSATP